MQLPAAQLISHLQKGLHPIYILHGNEALLMQEAADAVRAAARTQGFTERSVHTVEGADFDWGAVLAAAHSKSLFSERKIIEIRIPSGKLGKNGSAALEKLAAAARGNEATLTLVMLPRLDKTTRSTAWLIALEGAGISVQINALERAALPQWIAQRLALQGQRVAAGEHGQRTLQLFADRVEGNLLAAHQEIAKLALLHGEGELSLTQIESAVMNVARYDVFKLFEAVLAGQRARVQRMLDGLQAEGGEQMLVRVHFTLAENILALKRVKDAIAVGRPLSVALRDQRVWGPRERLFERVLPHLSDQLLAHLLRAAHEVDGIVKGLNSPDWPQQPWQALHRLAMGLTGACARAFTTPGDTNLLLAHGRGFAKRGSGCCAAKN